MDYKQVNSRYGFKTLSQCCKSALRILFVVINNVYCIPTYVIWMMLLYPMKRCHPDLYWRIEGHFFHWLLAMVAMWSWSAGYNLVELGDDIRVCLRDRTLVMANHQSTADVPLLMATFNAKPDVLPNLMWIMDRIFKFTNFGIVSVLHEDFFIVSGKQKRDESLEALARHLYKSFIPRGRKWVVLFPEGGFLRKRRETSQRFAQKNNLPILKHVSLPRTGAMRVIMEHIGYSEEALRSQQEQEAKDSGEERSNTDQNNVGSTRPSRSDNPKISWVLDITIAYPGGKPLDLPTIVTGSRPPCDTLLFYRLFKCEEIPVGKEEMTSWLYKIFEEKEEMLEAFYKTGVFPAEKYREASTPAIPVAQDPLRFLILHLFFITSSYVHYHVLSNMFTYIWNHWQGNIL